MTAVTAPQAPLARGPIDYLAAAVAPIYSAMGELVPGSPLPLGADETRFARIGQGFQILSLMSKAIERSDPGLGHLELDDKLRILTLSAYETVFMDALVNGAPSAESKATTYKALGMAILHAYLPKEHEKASERHQRLLRLVTQALVLRPPDAGDDLLAAAADNYLMLPTTGAPYAARLFVLTGANETGYASSVYDNLGDAGRGSLRSYVKTPGVQQEILGRNDPNQPAQSKALSEYPILDLLAQYVLAETVGREITMPEKLRGSGRLPEVGPATSAILRGMQLRVLGDMLRSRFYNPSPNSKLGDRSMLSEPLIRVAEWGVRVPKQRALHPLEQ